MFRWRALRSTVSPVRTGDAALGAGDTVMEEARALSRYPFGFFVEGTELTRLKPNAFAIRKSFRKNEMNFSVLDIQGSNQRFERGLGYDLYTIRDYVPSDSARHVHWKASAKTATLKTREYAAEESRRIVLAFDRFGHPSDVEKFEQLVSYTASLRLSLDQRRH